jgi:hypothetical protein
MLLTQTYAAPSLASLEGGGLGFRLATALNRPPVFLDATVRSSYEFAQAMLALHELVSSDLRPQQRDHSAYQAWVQQRYLEELDVETAAFLERLPVLTRRRDGIKAELALLEATRSQLEHFLHSSNSFKSAERKFFQYLYKADREQWFVLDPVISVHPDATLFEGFSLDESSYGRVTVPIENLELAGKPNYGTTNIDFSVALCRELGRVRTYRPAKLQVGSQAVAIGTTTGQAVEKKIDLPDSWVRGFLQVQSASGLPGTTVYFSPETISSLLFHLRRRREKQGPRSLRFRLTRWQKPTIEIEPWGTVLQEGQHAYDGGFSGEIRVWGRRRLFVLERLLPLAESVEVRLLGTGLPSFWSLSLARHRFDMGLSGWNANDWAKAAQFDLLTASAPVADAIVAQAAGILEERLQLDTRQLAERVGVPRPEAAAALQVLCARGEAMFDLACGAYRWRRLFPPELQRADNEAESLARRAQGLVLRGRVRPGARSRTDERGVERDQLVVDSDKQFHVQLGRDVDGRVVYAECTCGFFRHNKLRKGPCVHILAASIYLSARHGTHQDELRVGMQERRT